MTDEDETEVYDLVDSRIIVLSHILMVAFSVIKEVLGISGPMAALILVIAIFVALFLEITYSLKRIKRNESEEEEEWSVLVEEDYLEID